MSRTDIVNAFYTSASSYIIGRIKRLTSLSPILLPNLTINLSYYFPRIKINLLH